MQLYDTIEECLEAVNSGEVDYTYGTSYTTPYYLNIDELSNILYLPTSTQSIDICFGLAQPVDPDLLVILNKALRSLNSAQLDSIIYDNSLIDQDEQINLFIKDHLGEFALACISLLVLIIVLLALYLRSRMHAARAVREENLRFQELYRLANEQFFEYSINRTPCAFRSRNRFFPAPTLTMPRAWTTDPPTSRTRTHANSSSTVRTPSCWMRSPRRRTP